MDMSRTAFRSIEVHGAITTTPSVRPRVCVLPEVLLPKGWNRHLVHAACRTVAVSPNHPPSPEPLTLVTGIDRTLAAAARDSSSGHGISYQAAALHGSRALPTISPHRIRPRTSWSCAFQSAPQGVAHSIRPLPSVPKEGMCRGIPSPR